VGEVLLAFIFAHFEGNWGGRGVDVGIGLKGVDDRGKVVDAEKRRADPCFGFSWGLDFFTSNKVPGLNWKAHYFSDKLFLSEYTT
jgi:hypothetical protein